MKEFVIVADAACDLSEAMQKQYGIEIVAGHVSYNDKTEKFSMPKWDLWESSEAFYADIRKNPTAYTTSPANVGEFAEAFTKFAKEGKDVLAFSLSSGISGAYGFMTTASKMVMEQYPDCKIICIDTLRYSTAFGLILTYASNLRKEGKSMEQITAFMQENLNRFHQAGWLDDLSFLAKKGRLNNAKAFFGTLAGVKPIGEVDKNGLTSVLVKAKGKKSAYQILLGYMAETIENPTEQTIFIAQTNRLKEAEEYKKMIEEKFNPKEVIITDVFPLCGINIGPGLMAAYYVGKPISADLSQEKEIFERLAKEK